MEETAVLGIGPGFARWAELTDAYARKLTAMQLGEPGARAEAARLAREIQEMVEPVGVMMAPPRPPLSHSAVR